MVNYLEIRFNMLEFDDKNRAFIWKSEFVSEDGLVLEAKTTHP